MVAHRDPVGVYWFVVQVFDIRSAQPQMRLETFVFDGAGERVAALESRLLRVIQDESTDHEESHWTENERSEVERLATSAASTVADTIEAEVIERNDATIAVRTATLRRTYLGKITKRRAQIERATNDRIIRMWRSEVRRAEAELERKLADLEATRQVAVTFKPVGYGRLHLYRHDQPAPVPLRGPPNRLGPIQRRRYRATRNHPSTTSHGPDGSVIGSSSMMAGSPESSRSTPSSGRCWRNAFLAAASSNARCRSPRSAGVRCRPKG